MIFKFKKFSVAYTVFGNGNEILLAFHGFGRSKHDFELLEPALNDRFTVYSFDLFHHGESKYPTDRINKNTLTVDEFNALFEAFQQKNGINKFSLMGYSLGGKIALQLYAKFYSQITSVVLLAPDGLKKNFSDSFLSKTKFGNWMYRTMIKYPTPFVTFVKFIGTLRLISPKLKKFVLHHIEDEKIRLQVYHVWMTYRNISPNLKNIKSLINSSKVDFQLLFGKYDVIIPIKLGERFALGIDSTKVKLHKLNCGHMMFTDDGLREIGSILAIWTRNANESGKS